MRKSATIPVLTLMALLSMTANVMADVTSENDLDALLPHEDALAQLRHKIEADPKNQDNYLAYVRLADAFSKPDQMAWGYEQLLAVDPNLERVRLDLSLVYITLGRFNDARAQLNSVLAKNPPPAVQQNIHTVLAKIDEAEKKNHVSGSMTVGVASDSNANAAPGSGNVLVIDNLVPLSQTVRAQHDLQGFTALTAGDIYDIGRVADNVAMRWQTSGLAYLTRQDNLTDLDTQLYGVRSGPEFIYVPWDTHVHLTGGYNYMLLDTQSYLRDPNMELTADFPLTEKVRGLFESLLEYRQYLNSQTVTTYTDRAGMAWQTQAGVRYAFTPRSLWEAVVTLRREEAKENFYADGQFGATISHTYNFSSAIADGWLTNVFTNVRAGIVDVRYDNADPLTSAKIHDDSIRNLQFTLGRKLDNDVAITAAYSYTDALSNLQNYRYDNRRYIVSLTKNF